MQSITTTYLSGSQSIPVTTVRGAGESTEDWLDIHKNNIARKMLEFPED